jgi:predicted transcriptional regulator
MRSVRAEQAGLFQAVELARTQGFSWARIGVILGVSRQAAWQRFGAVDERLRDAGVVPPDDVPVKVEESAGEPSQDLAPAQPEVESVTVAAAPEPEPKHDFSAMNSLTTEEIVELAGRLPRDAKMFDAYLRAQREAIIVTLYKRGVTQPKIAILIGKSSQRVSQILNGYYKRLERTWEQQRRGLQKEV